jgi:hypothetical protein
MANKIQCYFVKQKHRCRPQRCNNLISKGNKEVEMDSWEVFCDVHLSEQKKYKDSRSTNIRKIKLVLKSCGFSNNAQGKKSSESTEEKFRKKIFKEFSSQFFDGKKPPKSPRSSKDQEEKKEEKEGEPSPQAQRFFHYTIKLDQKIQEACKFFDLKINAKIKLEIFQRLYRLKAMALHPDKNLNKDTTSEMQKLNDYRDLLLKMF